MLTEKDIDLLRADIDSGKPPTVYYLASRVERRESYIDEVAYKSNPQIDIVELQIANVTNALWELLNFKANPINYHTEQEIVIIDADNRYHYYYTVPNDLVSYNKPFNPKMPSAIYGCHRVRFKNGTVIGNYNDSSPIQPIFTNTLKFGSTGASEVLKMFEDGSLGWKYRNAPEGTVVDGIPFKYMTSNWFILEVANFPRPEQHLINVNQKNAFFIDLEKALSWREEMC